jgi:hypothetical protein
MRVVLRFVLHFCVFVCLFVLFIVLCGDFDCLLDFAHPIFVDKFHSLRLEEVSGP